MCTRAIVGAGTFALGIGSCRVKGGVCSASARKSHKYLREFHVRSTGLLILRREGDRVRLWDAVDLCAFGSVKIRYIKAPDPRLNVHDVVYI